MSLKKGTSMMFGFIILCGLAGCGLLATRADPRWQSPYQALSSLEEGDILHLPTGIKISQEELINMLASARLVYVGEAHDNMNAHKVQLEILKALSERYPGEIAVGLEMLKRSSQEMADQWISGDLEEKDFLRIWTEDWSSDFIYYRDILRFVRAERIPLVALRSPDDWVERIKEDEPIGASGGRADKLPEMDTEDPYHRLHTKAVFSEHPKHFQDFEDFYRVQVLWDESMAATTAEYLLSEEGQGKRMIIFAGNQHVEYGFGIPRRVFRRLPLPYAIVLPMTVRIPLDKQHKLMDVTMPEIPLLPADFAWIVSYEDLEDQRVYLGVMIRDTEQGAKILGTMKSSAASKAGLQKDDIITAFDGEPIKESFDLTYLISLKKPGDKGMIEASRNDEILSFEVTFETGGFHP